MGIELFVLAPVLLGGFVVLVVLAIVFGVRQQRQRRESLAAFAASIGWRYEANAVHLASRWRGTPFGRGSSRAVRHLLTGEFRGRQAAVLEYSFVTGSGDDETTSTFTVTMLSLPAALPDLQLTAEGLNGKLARALGRQDIQFESEEFNRRWRIEAAVLKTAHDIVHPRFMEYMLAGPADPLRIEGTDAWTWHEERLDTTQSHARLSRLADIVDMIPRHVWQDYGHAAPTGTVGA
ncbi:MAG: hypothetical protein M3Y20_07000 [Actinomycetota bacterium]|nr:hypothetical protein [Actinomycetota bacterium]